MNEIEYTMKRLKRVFKNIDDFNLMVLATLILNTIYVKELYNLNSSEIKENRDIRRLKK